MSALGHSRPSNSAPVLANVRSCPKATKNGAAPRMTLSANSGHEPTRTLRLMDKLTGRSVSVPGQLRSRPMDLAFCLRDQQLLTPARLRPFGAKSGAPRNLRIPPCLCTLRHTSDSRVLTASGFNLVFLRRMRGASIRQFAFVRNGHPTS